MAREWINFKELRKQISFENVLKFYGIEIKRKQGGRQHQGFCPLPTHNGSGKKSPSFSANLEKGVWQCFGCQASGNALDFVCRMEGLSPSDPQAIRKAALLIQERNLSGCEAMPPPPNKPNATAVLAASQITTPPIPAARIIINAPLDFELKGLDPTHAYLKQRGFMPETIQRFGLGYCNRGLFKGRIAIPLRDGQGKLIGYGGRIVNEAEINEENPKYKFPPARERDGILYEFHKSAFLYNGHNLPHPVEDLIVVEGFPAAWWLIQWGYANTVALMGSTCGEEQARLIVQAVVPDGSVWVFSDNDPAGCKCAESLLMQVSPYRFVGWVKANVPQPTDCTPADLAKLLWEV
jgi:DNA primase